MTTVRHVCVLFVAACGILGCGTEIPEAPKGERVSGTLSYAGTAAATMGRPLARVMMFIDFPPSGSPHAMLSIERPDFSKPVPYVLDWVTPASYKVLAQLIDLDSPNTDITTLPAGGYPNFCALSSPTQGFVAIQSHAPVQNVDVTLYDLAGQTDPCNVPTSICPTPGKASLSLIVRSSRLPTSADSLVFALFSTFPSFSPASSRKVTGDQLSFPATIVDNKLVPGTYSALYACLDVGSNSGMGLCSAEDAYVLDAATTIALVAGKITNVVADLDSEKITVTGMDAPTDRGCN